MLNQSFGNVSLQTVQAPKRGTCLKATNANGEHILMDFFGMNPAIVPDGTNAYFFGNALILVTRWSDMSDEEKNAVEHGALGIVLHPYECMQLSLKVDGRWSDVMVNLHHCYALLNDENAPVNQVIFVFSDTHNPDYIISRSVILPPFVQKRLQKSNVSSHEFLSFDDEIDRLRAEAQTDPRNDFFDLLYDLCWEKTKSFSRKARACEPDNVPDGIYIDIGSDNTVTNMYRHECTPPTVKMSSEVRLIMEGAEVGIVESQYNLGVSYEQGDGIDQDYEKAVYWYKKAADQGYAKAQYNLGVCLFNGYGTAADHKEAARLFLLSAEQGDMYAQFNIAVCYFNGVGVEKNMLLALKWLQKAADQGHPDAKRALGIG